MIQNICVDYNPGYHHFTHVPKITIIWCTVPVIRSDTDKTFRHFGPFFCPFTTPPHSPSPLMIPKIKILKNMKKTPGDIILLYIHVSHKWRSYDKWFMKYKVRKTENFIILGHFFVLSAPDNPENQNFKIEKNTWRYYHFTYLHNKWQSYDVWFLRYGTQQTELFVILDCFLPFHLHMDPEKQNFERMKKHLQMLSFHKCVP